MNKKRDYERLVYLRHKYILNDKEMRAYNKLNIEFNISEGFDYNLHRCGA